MQVRPFQLSAFALKYQGALRKLPFRANQSTVTEVAQGHVRPAAPSSSIEVERPPTGARTGQMQQPGELASEKRGEPAPLWRGQSSLPRFPVPSLESTVAKLKTTLLPFLEQGESKELDDACQDFVASKDVQNAQQLLTSVASSPSTVNWLEPLFDNAVYFQPPTPLPINYNFALGLGRPEYRPQPGLPTDGLTVACDRASRLLHGLLDFRQQVLTGELQPPAVMRGGKPVLTDTSQYLRLFHHARIPGERGDHNLCHIPASALSAAEGEVGRHHRTIFTGASGSQHSHNQGNHIILLHKGRMAAVEVMEPDETRELPRMLPVDALRRRLRAACKAMACATDNAGLSPCIFTTAERPAWARYRKELASLPPASGLQTSSVSIPGSSNAANLELVDSAIWVVAIDEVGSTKDFLCGIDNRYYDKHQLILNSGGGSNAGEAALLMEHSPLDGGTVLHLVKHMRQKETEPAAELMVGAPTPSKQNKATTVSSSQDEFVLRESDHSASEHQVAGTPGRSLPVAPVRHLTWTWNPFLKSAAVTAKDRVAAEASKLDCAVLALGAEFGARSFRTLAESLSSGPSPAFSADTFVQVAFQMAYHRLALEQTQCRPPSSSSGMRFPAVSVYESTSLTGFRHGRTEVTRSCTPEIHEFVKAFLAGGGADDSKAQLKSMLLPAFRSHGSYVRAAKEGKGVDRHLMGLKHMLGKSMQAQGGFGKDSAQSALLKPSLPRLFSHPAFLRASSWTLSTSNCSSEDVLFFGFGPVVDNGFGLGYVIRKESMAVHVSSWKNEPGSSRSEQFVGALERSLRDLKALLA